MKHVFRVYVYIFMYSRYSGYIMIYSQLHTIRYTLYTVHYIVLIVQSYLRDLHCTQYIALWIIVQLTELIIHCTMYLLNSI